jgi:hypothetical protein
MTINNFAQDINLNSEVEVTAWFFRPEPQSRRLKSFPKRMTWGGRDFDMSDGHTTYRLRQEGDHWTLVGIKGAI